MLGTIHHESCAHLPATTPGAYSIEELFHTIAGELGKQIEVVEYVAGSRSRLLLDAWRLRKLRADIHHVTGEGIYRHLGITDKHIEVIENCHSAIFKREKAIRSRMSCHPSGGHKP